MVYSQNIVIDFEFNPVRKGHVRKGVRNEIIEIGAVRLLPNGQEKDSYETFVRPALETTIAYNITRLTGIRRRDLADAPTFPDAFAAFCAWVGTGKTRIVTWSDTDKRVLSKQCAESDIEMPANMRRWMDLQAVYPRLMKISGGAHKKLALRGAADWGCDSFSHDSAHRALYDARKTAELMSQLLDGSYKEQIETAQSCLRDPEEESSLTSNLGSQFASLAQLKQTLKRNAEQ